MSTRERLDKLDRQLAGHAREMLKLANEVYRLGEYERARQLADYLKGPREVQVVLEEGWTNIPYSDLQIKVRGSDAFGRLWVRKRPSD